MKGERKKAPLKSYFFISFVFTSQCANSLAFIAMEVEDSVQSALGATVVHCACLLTCCDARPLPTDQ